MDVFFVCVFFREVDISGTRELTLWICCAGKLRVVSFESIANQRRATVFPPCSMAVFDDPAQPALLAAGLLVASLL
jgi:hypothetical protein